MSTKLTLTVEKTLIERAKQFARKSGRSLSELVEHYFEYLTNEKSESELSPQLKSLVGAVSLPPDFDEERELRTALEDKHLRS